MPTTFTTGEVSRKIGVNKSTLLRWLYAGRLTEPRHANAGGQDVRVWSPEDLARAKKFKVENYRKKVASGRGRSARPANEVVKKQRRRRPITFLSVAGQKKMKGRRRVSQTIL